MVDLIGAYILGFFTPFIIIVLYEDFKNLYKAWKKFRVDVDEEVVL